MSKLAAYLLCLSRKVSIVSLRWHFASALESTAIADWSGCVSCRWHRNDLSLCFKSGTDACGASSLVAGLWGLRASAVLHQATAVAALGYGAVSDDIGTAIASGYVPPIEGHRGRGPWQPTTRAIDADATAVSKSVLSGFVRLARRSSHNESSQADFYGREQLCPASPVRSYAAAIQIGAVQLRIEDGPHTIFFPAH